jgi:hypothetical protein
VQKEVQKAAPKKTELPCLVYFDARRNAYFLQISSWLTSKKAASVANKVRRVTGMKTFTVTAKIPSLGRRVRVFLGYFATVKEAEEMCLRVNADG